MIYIVTTYDGIVNCGCTEMKLGLFLYVKFTPVLFSLSIMTSTTPEEGDATSEEVQLISPELLFL